MELHLERAQPCPRESTFELSRPQLQLRRHAFAFQKLAVIAHAVLNADHRPINDHI